MQRWWTALDARELDGVLDLFSVDCDFVMPGMRFRGAEQMKAYVENYLHAFPDFQTEILMSVASDRAIAYELRSTGTQSGPLGTPEGQVAPTAAKVVFDSCLFARAENGKITYFHTYFDHPEWVGPG